MKQHLLNGMLVSIASVLLSCGSGEQKGSQPDSTVGKQMVAVQVSTTTVTCADNPTGESSLSYGDLSTSTNVYAFEKQELEDGRTNFDNNFKIKNPQGQPLPLANPVHNMAMSYIFTMLDDVKNNQNFDPANDHSALKMHYGMDQQAMVIIFEPIILKHYSTDKYTVISTDKFYRITGNTVNIITATATNTLKQNYHNNVWIDHVDNPSNDFDPSDDFFAGDTRYTIIPIQQIITMYCDNSNASCNNHDNDIAAADIVSFSIVANDFFYSGRRHIENFKLHVIVYKNGTLQDDVHETCFLHCGADFTQMCPPNCNYVNLNYYGYSLHKVDNAPKKVDLGSNEQK